MDTGAGLFHTEKRNTAVGHARRYLSGLLSASGRKNMERMNERIGSEEGQDYEGMQHFLSGSPWDERKVYDFVAEQADGRLGGHPDSQLILDESGFGKKGDSSVGVARQHNGRLGKRDNCQVGVYSVLNCGIHSALVGARLFLPEEWVEDPERCKKAGVPEEQIKERTKIDLARELVVQALEQEIRFSCVGMDAFYGRDATFLEWLNDQKLTYCADVPANALVFENLPESEKRPEKMSKVAARVDKLAEKLIAESKATMVDLREGENGLVRVEVWKKSVWVWPAKRKKPRESQLLVRRNADGSLKISLSNAEAETKVERLAKWQGGRYFVEKTFQDGKSHAGMAQYQARGWRAWHHHMAMVALALLFMMEQRMLLAQSAPLLSPGDIVEILDWHLAKKRTHAETVAAIEARHRQRERNALSAQNRARERACLPALEKMHSSNLTK